MIRFLFTTYFIITAHFLVNIQAQEKVLIDIPAAESLSQDATKMIFERKSDEAFNLLSLYWPYSQEDLHTLSDKFKLENEGIQESFGALISYEKGPVYEISNFRRRIIYYLRYDYFALRLIFEFHQSQKGWILNGFKYSQEMDDDFQKVKSE